MNSTRWWIVLLVSLFYLGSLVQHSTSTAVLVPISPGNVAQNSDSLLHTAQLSVDSDPSTYSETNPNGTTPATWQALLNAYYYITKVEIKRANCCPDQSSTTTCCSFHLQDIIIEVVDFNGTVQDFSGGHVVSPSDILYPSSMLEEPTLLTWDRSSSPARGNWIRIYRRTDEVQYELGMAEVEVTGIIDVCSTCNVNAECHRGQGMTGTCRCKYGYYGDGFTCTKTLGIPKIQSFVIHDVTSTWQTVDLPHISELPVPVCTPVLQPDVLLQGDGSNPPARVVRLRTVTNSFEIRLQNPSDLVPPPSTVFCVVVEQGVYDGMEAFQIVHQETDHYPYFNGVVQSYKGQYNQPVVLGQVLSHNDPQWVTFWASNTSDTSQPPGTTSFRFGKHSGNSTRAPVYEIIGYIVLESGYLRNNTLLATLTPALAQNGSLSQWNVSGSLTTGAVLSPAGISSPFWPTIASLSPSSLNVFFDVDFPSRLLSQPERASVLYFSDLSPFTVLPPFTCSSITSKCNCTDTGICAWCAAPSSVDNLTSICLTNNNGLQSYCLSSGSQWITESTAGGDCHPVPSTPTVSPLVPPTPVPPYDGCQGLDVCTCLSIKTSFAAGDGGDAGSGSGEVGGCSYCKVLSGGSSECYLNVPFNEANCKNAKGSWIPSGSECGLNVTHTHEATSTLSAGAQFGVGSAVATLSMGCILVTVAVVLFIWGIVKGCRRRDGVKHMDTDL